MLWLHVAGGGLSLLAGYAALHAAKGAASHRRFGRVFVYAMITMGTTGALIAALTGVETSVVMGLFATYLVVTGFTAVTTNTHQRWFGVGCAAAALMLALALSDLGRRALASPGGVIEGLPAPMAFVFAAVAIIASVSDVRWTLNPQPTRARLIRHLWRMCFALFCAAASFFLGQTDEIPRALRIPALLAIPVLLPLLAMAIWRWRLRVRRDWCRDANASVRA